MALLICRAQVIRGDRLSTFIHINFWSMSMKDKQEYLQAQLSKSQLSLQFLHKLD